jgi:uncharacterized membrane protein
MTQLPKEYENNPFTAGLTGLNLVFEKARGVAILLIVISILSVFSGSFSRGENHEAKSAFPTLSPEQWALFGGLVAIIVLAGIFISAMLSGISAYTSARIARGHDVTLNEAFHVVLDRFFSYIWLQIILIVKILLWSLLLIVPGFIMSYRYSLASIAFFDKKLTGNAAIEESLQLTKGAWLTTFASQALFNLITLGVISELVTAGARTILYRQFSALKGKEKPTAHMLSWVALFLPFALLIIFVMFVAMIAIVAASLGLLTV